MKKYVKSSFGYYDKDWVDPDDYFDSNEAEVIFNNELLTVGEDFYEFVNDSELALDDYSDQTGALVATGREIVDFVYDAIYDDVPEGPAKYRVSGIFTVPYVVESDMLEDYIADTDWSKANFELTEFERV